MARYILIDHRSGLIWADTANIEGGPLYPSSPLDAAKLADASLRDLGIEYELVHRLAPNDTGYVVHRADYLGHDLVPPVVDKWDPVIACHVVATCPVAGVVRVFYAE